MEQATLAGGCFWCMEWAFHAVTGITAVEVGYIQGTEVIRLNFDPDLITYLQILDIYWTHIDPLDQDGQFADRGKQYHTIIFTHNGKQVAEATASLKVVESLFEQPIMVKILPVKKLIIAEDIHQAYCHTYPERFFSYQASHLSHLKKLWGGKKKILYQTLLEEKLTSLQFHVTQQAGTEQPFKNPYWHLKEEGLYLDIITREPLFSSVDKYDSGTGWPSFTKPLLPLIQMPDCEVLSPYSHAHLGHVFADGPKQSGGLRYCMNSAALFFLPLEKAETDL